jgi:PAS domain S-box-containing protein
MSATEPVEGGGTGADGGRWGADASHYRELADLLPDAVYEADAQLGLTYANRTAFAMFGYTTADLESGLDLFSLMHEDERARARDNLAHKVREVLDAARSV